MRRLVRQFDLDITGIHGTGPAGRIRVGDVMGLLGGRTDSGNRDAPARPVTPEDDLDDGDETAAPARPRPAAAEAPAHDVVPTSTVFDCDLSRVLAHRRKLRLENAELLTTSYFLTALAAALDAAPEITTGEPPRFGVWLTTVDGERRSSFLDAPSVLPEAALDERVRAIDAALRANLDADVAPANLLVHHYGESGSLRRDTDADRHRPRGKRRHRPRAPRDRRAQRRRRGVSARRCVLLSDAVLLHRPRDRCTTRTECWRSPFGSSSSGPSSGVAAQAHGGPMRAVVKLS